MYKGTYTSTYTDDAMNVYLYIYTIMYIYIYACIYIYICICMCVCIYIYDMIYTTRRYPLSLSLSRSLSVSLLWWARLDQVHLHVELLLGGSQHPSPRAEPALGCGRPKPREYFKALGFFGRASRSPEPGCPRLSCLLRVRVARLRLGPETKNETAEPTKVRSFESLSEATTVASPACHPSASEAPSSERETLLRPSAVLAAEAPTRVQTCGATRRRGIATASLAPWSL